MAGEHVWAETMIRKPGELILYVCFNCDVKCTVQDDEVPSRKLGLFNETYPCLGTPGFTVARHMEGDAQLEVITCDTCNKVWNKRGWAVTNAVEWAEYQSEFALHKCATSAPEPVKAEKPKSGGFRKVRPRTKEEALPTPPEPQQPFAITDPTRFVENVRRSHTLEYDIQTLLYRCKCGKGITNGGEPMSPEARESWDTHLILAAAYKVVNSR